MAYILNIETATKKCSVAVGLNGSLVAFQEIAEEHFSHAEKLHLFIEQALQEAAINFSELSAIAVSKGPGSYTGLRIGVSAAKGLSYALQIPLLSVDTLKVIAKQLSTSKGYIVPMIDARRMEVFTQVFDASCNEISKAKALIVTPEAYSEFNSNLHLLGDGALKCKEILSDSRFIYHPKNIFPSAKEMVAISYEKFLKNDFEDLAYFEPFYLKDFQITK